MFIPLIAISSDIIHYDAKLANLLLTDPDEVLRLSKVDLIVAKQDGNIEKQMVSLLYIANAMSYLGLSDEIDAIIDKGLKLSTKNNNLLFISEFFGHRSNQQEIRGQYSEAIVSADLAIKYASDAKNDRLIGENLSLRSQAQLAKGNYSLALKDVEEALDIFKNYNDKENISYNYNLLALIYYDMSDFDSAIKYFFETDKYDTTESPFDKASLYYNIGTAYLKKNNLILALENYQKSKKYSTLANDKNSLAFVNFGMAKIKIIQSELVEAKQYLESSLKNFTLVNDHLMEFNNYLMLSSLELKNGDLGMAKHNLEEAESRIELLDSPSVRHKYIVQEIAYYTSQNMWRKVVILQRQEKLLIEKYHNKILDKSITETKVKFDIKLDQEKLLHLVKQNELQESVIQQAKIKQQYMWVLIVLAIFLLLVISVAYRYQIKIKKQLFKLSVTDYLTKVANRRYIMQTLKLQLKESLEDKTRFGIAMIDLDYFKSINDTYGHDVGNQVLIYFAQLAKNIVGVSGEVGRIGGEEWLLIFPNISMPEIKSKLKKLRISYKQNIPEMIPKDCVLSFSSGVVLCNGQYQGYEKILFDVDTAMYLAKEKGREQDVYI